MNLSNLPVRQIVGTAEDRMIDAQFDAYRAAAARNQADRFCTVEVTTGSRVRLYVNTDVVKFKTSEREDDVEFQDMSNGRWIEAPVMFNHLGTRVGISSLADSNGEGAGKMLRYGQSVGAEAGYHTMSEVLRHLKENTVCKWDDKPTFATNHVDGFGSTFDNAIVGDIMAGDLDTAKAALNGWIAQMKKVRNEAGFALDSESFEIFGSPAVSSRVRTILFGQQVLATDNSKAFDGGISYTELPQLTFVNDASQSIGSRTLFIVAKPVTGHGAMVHVQREGLSTQTHSDLTDAALSRMGVLEYVSRFRDSVICYDPKYIARVQPSS